MPEEVRRIMFNFSEVTKALRDYTQNHDVWLPEGSVARVRRGKKAQHELQTMRGHTEKVQRDHNVSDASDDIMISFFDEVSLEHAYANLSKAFIAAALIEYCISHKILLPKEAQKSIEVEELHVCMDIRFNAASGNEAPILSLEEDE